MKVCLEPRPAQRDRGEPWSRKVDANTRKAATRSRSSWLSRIGMAGRIALMLFALLPMAVTLALLESGTISDPVNMLVVSLAVGLGLLAPVSRLGASFLVLRDLRAINEYYDPRVVRAFRQGREQVLSWIGGMRGEVRVTGEEPASFAI